MKYSIPRIILTISILTSSALYASSSIDRLVYDVKSPGHFCWLEKVSSKGEPLPSADASAILNGTKPCPQDYLFDKQSDFFRSGAVVQLFVVHGKLRSVFKVTANGTEIQPELPQIRGIPDAQPAQAPSTPGAVTKAGGPEINELSDNTVNNYPNKTAAENEIRNEISKLQAEYIKAKASSAQASRAKGLIFGTAPANPPSLPGFTLANIKSFADSLTNDTQGKVSQVPFTDRIAFDSLTDRCDNLVEATRGINSRLASSKLNDLMASAQTDADTLKASASVAQSNVAKISARFSGQNISGVDVIYHYLPSGDKYSEIDGVETTLQAGADDVPTAIDAINSDLQAIFNAMNTVYENSQMSTPFVVLIGQWGKNTVVGFELREVPGFKHYGFGETGDVQLGQSQNQPQQGAVPVSPPAQNPAAAQPKNSGNGAVPQGASPGNQNQNQNTAQPQGNLLETDSFNVHQFFRANVVSGFFASTLHNRQYGVTQGQASGSQSTQTIATIGDVTRPQIHYFVGLNYYFKQRDLFPGALEKSDYLIPGAFFGYGVDDSNNFLLGPNWETKWGINLGFGGHIGRETFLRKDVVAGTTPLPSGTTAPPTITRPKLGFYLSAGFDLSVFKSVFGQVIGGNSTSTGTDTSDKSTGGSKK